MTTLLPAWKQATKDFLAAGFAEGQVIDHDWFWTAFGLVEPDAATPYALAERARLDHVDAMSNLRRELLVNHQIDLRNVPGRGYEWVPVGKQTRTAFSDGMTEIHRGMRKMAARVVNVDHTRLSPAQAKENAEAQARIGKMAALMSSTRRLPKF